MADRDDIIRMLEEIAPPGLAEPFDEGRIGLIVEGKREIRKVCTALDATPAVVSQAVSGGADLLVVHHTPIWNPLTAIRGADTSLFRMVLAADLNLYVMHTNYDHAPGGVNHVLADLLGLSDRTAMSLGLTGICTLSPGEISSLLHAPLRIWGALKEIRRLAVAAGSGFDPVLFGEAVAAGADAFLSAELKHSVARSSPLLLLESTHYALEAPAMKALAVRQSWEYLDDPPLLTSVP